MKVLKNYIFKTAILLSLSVFIVFMSCKKDSDPTPRSPKALDPNGLTREINDLVPEGVLAEIIRLQMPIFSGNNPPILTSAYLAEPFILLSSNIDGDFIGFKYPDYKVEFSELNIFDLTINLRYISGNEKGEGIGGFIVGQGDNFSVFLEVESVIDNDTASFAHVISGSVTPNGIENLYFANFMLDDRGDPNDVWVAPGQGRVAYDRDSLSVPIAPF